MIYIFNIVSFAKDTDTQTTIPIPTNMTEQRSHEIALREIINGVTEPLSKRIVGAYKHNESYSKNIVKINCSTSTYTELEKCVIALNIKQHDAANTGLVISGVPQGTVLGPILFLIYINDRELAIQDSSTSSFADDTRISREIQLTEDNEILQSDLNNVIDWSTANTMELHEKKF